MRNGLFFASLILLSLINPSIAHVAGPKRIIVFTPSSATDSVRPLYMAIEVDLVSNESSLYRCIENPPANNREILKYLKKRCQIVNSEKFHIKGKQIFRQVIIERAHSNLSLTDLSWTFDYNDSHFLGLILSKKNHEPGKYTTLQTERESYTAVSDVYLR